MRAVLLASAAATTLACSASGRFCAPYGCAPLKPAPAVPSGGGSVASARHIETSTSPGPIGRGRRSALPDVPHALPDFLHGLPDFLRALPDVLRALPDFLRAIPHGWSE